MKTTEEFSDDLSVCVQNLLPDARTLQSLVAVSLTKVEI